MSTTDTSPLHPDATEDLSTYARTVLASMSDLARERMDESLRVIAEMSSDALQSLARSYLTLEV